MEQRVLDKLQKQLEEGPKKITIENMYLVKITEPIRDFMLKFTNCKSLSLNFSRLSSLTNMPDLPDLETLQLNDNSLKDSDLETIAKFKKLKYLYIGGNKIKELKSFEALKDLASLKFLDVYNNPFTSDKNYMGQLFELLPQLKVIDYLDRNRKEVEDLYSDDTEEESGEEDDDEFISYDGDEDGNDKEREVSGKIQNDIGTEEIDDGGEYEDDDEDENEGDNAEEISETEIGPDKPEANNRIANNNTMVHDSNDVNGHAKRDISESQVTDEFDGEKTTKKVNSDTQNINHESQ